MASRYTPELIRRCYDEVAALHRDATRSGVDLAADLARIAPAHRESARNLLHYLALRRHDIRSLQVQLGDMGLSSLGRLEAHVLAGLESVLAALRRMADEPLEPVTQERPPLHFREGDDLLALHTEQLLGPAPSGRAVRIMVTLPGEAATEPQLLVRLLEAGMDVARINCAHDDAPAWEAMVAHLRRAVEATGRACRVLVDLEGPKLRTGAVEPGPRSLHLIPRRDERGQVVRPARAVLVPQSQPLPAGLKGKDTVPVSDDLAGSLEAGDTIVLVDVPGRQRELRVTGREGAAVWTETRESVYLEPGLRLQHMRQGTALGEGAVGELTPQAGAVVLRPGDLLLVTGPDVPGRAARLDGAGKVVEPARISCALPGIFATARPDQRIFFDDGAIAGVIEEVRPAQLVVRVGRARSGGSQLRSDKGINLPDTELRIPSLSPDDMGHLDFAAAHADMVGLSFVQEPAAVAALQRELAARTTRQIGTILKIETPRSFENLPRLLLSGLRWPPVGVMVARGDLGVEVGFERMAEVQEEILWLCEAAHVPVIWATQVLEQMTKRGMPSRGEVTDAAMSSRAECVMLNKGPFVVDSVVFLSGILTRMQDHHHKKTPMLRKLKVSEGRWLADGSDDEAPPPVSPARGDA